MPYENYKIPKIYILSINILQFQISLDDYKTNCGLNIGIHLDQLCKL